MSRPSERNGKAVFYTFRTEKRRISTRERTLGYSPCGRTILASYSPLFLVIPGVFLPGISTLYCQDRAFGPEYQKDEKQENRDRKDGTNSSEHSDQKYQNCSKLLKTSDKTRLRKRETARTNSETGSMSWEVRTSFKVIPGL